MDCEKYLGRMRQICEGTSGHSPEERAAYLQLWENAPTRPPKMRLGDFVAKAIKVATFGLVKPTPNCGCAKRKEALNDWWDRIWDGTAAP